VQVQWCFAIIATLQVVCVHQFLAVAKVSAVHQCLEIGTCLFTFIPFMVGGVFVGQTELKFAPCI